MKLIIASKNPAKIREIKEILDADIDLKTYQDFTGWPEVEETGQTFYENALIKARKLADKYKMPALADDSGLIVEVLGQEPGIRSSRYAGEEAMDPDNINKLLGNLAGIENRKAYFMTAAVFYNVPDQVISAKGKVYGKIIDRPCGSGGFGYDPIFVPEGYDRTFAEMTSAEKNKLSHRGRALQSLKALLQEKGLL